MKAGAFSVTALAVVPWRLMKGAAGPFQICLLRAPPPPEGGRVADVIASGCEPRWIDLEFDPPSSTTARSTSRIAFPNAATIEHSNHAAIVKGDEIVGFGPLQSVRDYIEAEEVVFAVRRVALRFGGAIQLPPRIK